MRRSLALLLMVVTVSLVTTGASAVNAEPASPLPRDQDGILDSDDLTIVVTELKEFEITVDQRYFNLPGNEQRGLRTVTDLVVGEGESYLVPSAPPGYNDVSCGDVGATTEDPLEVEGPGTFSAEASGVHLVCYQQVPGEPRGPRAPQEVEVLGVVIERPDDADAASSPDGQDPAPVALDGSLAQTGLPLAGLGLVGLVSLGIGSVLRRRRLSD